MELTDMYAGDGTIDFDRWFNSPYHPTPTIIAAAVEAYLTKDISEIANSEAGQADIDACEAQLNTIIEDAEKNHKKCICFVTGVPGAGKTLVGLDIVVKNLKKEKETLSVYLSGNGPLVDVLRAALKKSAKEQGKDRRETSASVDSLIQSSYNFKKDNAQKKDPTIENILIFDEAQRVWNEAKMRRKHDKDPLMSVSEPHLLYQIMDRHNDWAVMICLVGLGQDIYDGEVGINEWFRCGIQDFPAWELYYSEDIFQQTEDKDIDRSMIEECTRCHKVSGLHLKTSIRSFRADKQSRFVDALLDNKPEEAKHFYEEIAAKYPVYITRDLKQAKRWARAQVRGSQRCGMLASSGAQRLKPDGVYVLQDIDVKNWFLAPSDDLRSSNMMEVTASEFKVQGLEIDWAVVCWDADLRRKNDKEWAHYSFRGTKWNKRNKEEQKRYLVNAYRVLLTRARQGMVIFVPYGDDPEDDPTRDHAFYDGIYEYLLRCGIKELESEN